MKNVPAKVALTGVLITAAEWAQAAVPMPVDTAITTMAADGVTVATAILVAIIGVVAIKFLRKAI